MNILIFDHKNRLIQFQANLSWAHEFLLNVRLYSKDPQEVQDYIEEALKPPMVFSHQSKALSVPHIYDLSDKAITAQIPGENLILSELADPFDNESKMCEWGVVAVDCVRKKIVSMSELDDGSINEYNSIDLQCYHRKSPHEKGERPSAFASLVEQHAFVSRINALFEHNYWTCHNYENGMVELYPAPIPELQEVHALLKSDLEKGTFTEPYVSGKENICLVLNPLTTGWKFNQSQNYTETQVYNDFVRTMFDAGLVLTEAQEKVWRESYETYEASEYRPLDFSFLEIARQKALLQDSIQPVSRTSATATPQHKI